MKRVDHIVQWVNSHYTVTVGWTIAALALWQFIVASFGVDLCDSGYYLTFFDNIFKAPECVEYNFMYYLSGVAGGALDALLPEGGEWLAMRVCGVLCNVGVMAILAWALRRVIPATAVILGFLMVVASLEQFPYTFNNDLMSVLLWVAALALTFKGLTGSRLRLLLLAGVLVGVNIFTRIPNVLAVGLVVMPFIARLHYRGRPWSACWRQCGTLLVGMTLGVAAVIVMMMSLGHWDVFSQNMKDLTGIATGSSGEASHNVADMVMVMLGFYKQCLFVALKLLALWLFVRGVRYLKYAPLRYAALLIIAVVTLYFMWYQSHIMHPLWVMCVVGLVLVIAHGGERAVAAWLGLFMLLVFPLGSDGATNNGGIIAWMAAPVAALVWQRRSNIIFPLAFIVVGLVQTVTLGAYFDGGPLWHKKATINVPHAAWIHTTPERADIINTTLSKLAPLVQDGDTLLCYGSIPMMNHLTRSVPAIGCPWPELLSAEAITARLEAMGDSRPAVLRQKFNNLGPFWSAPTDDYLHAYPREDKFLKQSKMDALIRWMETNGYRITWENEWFALYYSD